MPEFTYRLALRTFRGGQLKKLPCTFSNSVWAVLAEVAWVPSWCKSWVLPPLSNNHHKVEGQQEHKPALGRWGLYNVSQLVGKPCWGFRRCASHLHWDSSCLPSHPRLLNAIQCYLPGRFQIGTSCSQSQRLKWWQFQACTVAALAFGPIHNITTKTLELVQV